MTRFEIQQQDNPSKEALAFVQKHFRAFNDQHGGVFPSKELHLFAYDSEQNVLGALFGDISWGWLHVDVIWVDAQQRLQGVGSRLMDRAEAEAIAMGVKRAYLETADFQAFEFYKKRGYELFAQLEEQPPGHTCYYMKHVTLGDKNLNS